MPNANNQKDNHKRNSNWIEHKILDVAPLQRGFDLPVSQIQLGNYPVVFSNGTHKFHNIFKVKGPGVVTGRSGTIGKVYYIEKDFWPHNTSLWVTDFKGNSPKYIYYFYTQLDLTTLSAGSGVPTLNRNDVHSKKIKFPPLPEQRRIVAVLETWDATIEKLNKKIKIKKNIKKGLMQQLLTGKKRLSGFSGEWKEFQINEIGSVVTGNTPSKANNEFYGSSFHWATALDFKGMYIQNTEIKLSEKGREVCREVPLGAVLVTCIASIGKNGIAKQAMAFNQQINAIVPNINFNSEFIYFLIENSFKKLQEVAGGGAMAMISKGIFEKIKLKCPKLHEQEVISDILLTLEKEIESLEYRKNLVQAQKTYLLNNLVSGKILTPENLSFVPKESTTNSHLESPELKEMPC